MIHYKLKFGFDLEIQLNFIDFIALGVIKKRLIVYLCKSSDYIYIVMSMKKMVICKKFHKCVNSVGTMNLHLD